MSDTATDSWTGWQQQISKHLDEHMDCCSRHHGTTRQGSRGIRIQSSHLSGVVEALEGIDHAQLQAIARETEDICTVSLALREGVSITSDALAR